MEWEQRCLRPKVVEICTTEDNKTVAAVESMLSILDNAWESEGLIQVTQASCRNLSLMLFRVLVNTLFSCIKPTTAPDLCWSFPKPRQRARWHALHTRFVLGFIAQLVAYVNTAYI